MCSPGLAVGFDLVNASHTKALAVLRIQGYVHVRPLRTCTLGPVLLWWDEDAGVVMVVVVTVVGSRGSMSAGVVMVVVVAVVGSRGSMFALPRAPPEHNGISLCPAVVQTGTYR